MLEHAESFLLLVHARNLPPPCIKEEHTALVVRECGEMRCHVHGGRHQRTCDPKGCATVLGGLPPPLVDPNLGDLVVAAGEANGLLWVCVSLSSLAAIHRHPAPQWHVGGGANSIVCGGACPEQRTCHHTVITECPTLCRSILRWFLYLASRSCSYSLLTRPALPPCPCPTLPDLPPVCTRERDLGPAVSGVSAAGSGPPRVQVGRCMHAPPR